MSNLKNTSAEVKEVAVSTEKRKEINKCFIAAAAAPEELDWEEKQFALHVKFENREDRECAFQHFNEFGHCLNDYGYKCDTAMREGDLEITCWCTLYGEAMLKNLDFYNSIDDQLNCTKWAADAIQDLRVEISDDIAEMEEQDKFGGVYLNNIHKIVDTLLVSAELRIDSEDEEERKDARTDFQLARHYLKRLAFAILDYNYDRGK